MFLLCFYKMWVQKTKRPNERMVDLINVSFKRVVKCRYYQCPNTILIRRRDTETSANLPISDYRDTRHSDRYRCRISFTNHNTQSFIHSERKSFIHHNSGTMPSGKVFYLEEAEAPYINKAVTMY